MKSSAAPDIKIEDEKDSNCLFGCGTSRAKKINKKNKDEKDEDGCGLI